MQAFQVCTADREDCGLSPVLSGPGQGRIENKKLNFDQGIGLKISKKEIKITKNTEKTITLLQYFACVGPLPTSHHISSENYTK